MKVLVVDDNADDRYLLRLNLEHQGCTVIEAADGAEGLQLAKDVKPDLIVSDALMPVMDGFQLLRRLKSDEALRTIPFIFYSSVYTDGVEADLAAASGSEAFIIKPRDPQEFWEELQRIMGDREHKKDGMVSISLIGETDFLGQYSQMVATRLEGKVKELEAVKVTLKSSEARFRATFEQAAVGIAHVGIDGRWLMVNDKLCEIIGYSREELLTRSFQEITHDDDLEKNLDSMQQLLADEVKTYSLEKRYHRKDGSLVWINLTVSLVHDDQGEPDYFISVIEAIDDRKKIEAQLRQSQKMESIGTLAGGIAHDFNNILTAIIGYGTMALMKMTEDNPQRLNIEQMISGANRAARLTRDLLLFSRKQPFVREIVDLNEILRKVEPFLLRVIGEDIECKILPQEEPTPVFADDHQIEQVLMNLATNARDAMTDGGTLTVKTEQVTLGAEYVATYGYGKPGTYALLTASDTGQGMDAETQKQIFDPFFTTKDVGKGTGLGLAVVYGIIKGHDGFINVYSEPGLGTTFRIYLPLKVQKAVESTAPSPEAAPARGTETILLAEDNDLVRDLVMSVLTMHGYAVIEAIDGSEAVRKFCENADRIDLLLLDLIMPKMNGNEAFAAICKIRPDIKVIFASGYAPETIREKVAFTDEVHLIAKPVTPVDLLRKVREVLDGVP